MLNSENLLLIFTRNPEFGKVKSRLAADVGKQSALDIYKFLLSHTKKVTKNLKVDKQVWYSDKVTKNDIWDNEVYSKLTQLQIDDLGKRMKYAFEKGFEAGYKNIIIIGSDLYDINEEDLRNAFKILRNNEALIGPAEDGGFYLLGLSQMIPELFSKKNWGTNSVLTSTLENLKNYTFEALDEKNDVDYLIDIQDISIFQQFLAKRKTRDKQ